MGSCAPQLINEQTLYLEHHRIGDVGMRKIMASHNTRVVKELDASGNNLTPLSLSLFPKGKWNSLTYLSFNKNKLGDKGCKYLSMTALNRMKRLVISQNNIGNAGILHLSKATWKSLTSLVLNHNHMQYEGAQCLSKAKWASIEQIQAYDNNIDDAFALTLTIIHVTAAPNPEDTQQLGIPKLSQRGMRLLLQIC